MAVDGNWNITMSTPMGERKATLTLLTAGGTLTGTQGADGNSSEIFDGTINGDDVAWKISITNPMPLTLAFIRQGLRRQHVRRNGHRPDGQLPVHRDAGVTAMARRPQRLLVLSSMHKLVLFSIAALASLAGAAIAQTPEPEPAWRRSALAFVPAGYIGGDAYRTDEAAMTGYLAVYPANASDPKSPASVFTPRQALVVKLTRGDSGLRAAAAELQPRVDPIRGNRDTTMTDPDGEERQFEKLDAELAAGRAKLPEGTEPCSLGAWSWDRDPNGLNVRAEPSVKARVLGTLPPPYRLKMGGSENTPEGGWLTEFRIIGFKDGWFLIEGATPPGKEYEDERSIRATRQSPIPGAAGSPPTRSAPTTPTARTRMGGLFQAPFVDAQWMPAQRKLGGNARHRRRPETPARLQRPLGAGGKP